MPWIYLPKAVSVQATVESLSDSDSSHLLELSSTLNGTPSSNSLSNDGSPTDSLTMPPFGTISPPSMELDGVTRWISSLGGCLANHTPQPDPAKVLTMSVISGRPQGVLLARYSRNLSYWRTCEAFLRRSTGKIPFRKGESRLSLHTPQPYLETLPYLVMTRSLDLYQLPPLVLPTSVGGGSVLPTPQVWDRQSTLMNKRAHAKKWGDAKTLAGMAKMGMWPTPTVQDAHNNGGPAQFRRDTLPLNAKVKMYETSRGELNPRWVEWLMNIPIGWVSINPLSAESYNEWSNANNNWFTKEPVIPRITADFAGRTDELEALGNGVVPLQLAYFIRKLSEAA